MAVNSIPGHQNVADAVCIDGVQGAITVTATPVAVRVGAANANRKIATAYNNSSSTIYWGWNSDVTTSSGTPIEGYTLMTWAVGKDIDVWLVSAGSINVRVTEAR